MISPAIFNSFSDLKKQTKTFETVIDPNEAMIPIPREFCKAWNTEIGKHSYGWIVGPDFGILVIFHVSETQNSLSSGRDVAKAFRFVEPTKVKLEYAIQKNTFYMKTLPRMHDNNQQIEIIQINSTDDESDAGKNRADYERRRNNRADYERRRRVKVQQSQNYSKLKQKNQVTINPTASKVLVQKNESKLPLKRKLQKDIIADTSRRTRSKMLVQTNDSKLPFKRKHQKDITAVTPRTTRSKMLV
ncbi:uncharacterized protein LOC123886626 [Trifolium pratense]|uniref:uncharacterized protein LOC123886626 n=1 Tax=Trifolium pratense TaxID=57577 RepID=UPI001E69239F|nr:uncharacterized protein LOC123886626 [Trifolium pratense]